jgi:hypothetical protein
MMQNLKNALFSTWLLQLQCVGHTAIIEEMGTRADQEQVATHNFWCFQQMSAQPQVKKGITNAPAVVSGRPLRTLVEQERTRGLVDASSPSVRFSTPADVTGRSYNRYFPTSYV